MTIEIPTNIQVTPQMRLQQAYKQGLRDALRVINPDDSFQEIQEKIGRLIAHASY